MNEELEKRYNVGEFNTLSSFFGQTDREYANNSSSEKFVQPSMNLFGSSDLYAQLARERNEMDKRRNNT